jgi:hypothetical protein
MGRLVRASLLLSLAATTLVPAGNALANDLCGTTIVAGFVQLQHDHLCPAGTAITLDANFPSTGIELDLNGFTIDGAGTGQLGIDVVPGSSNVTIRSLVPGGRVVGYQTAIRVGSCGALAPATDTQIELVGFSGTNTGILLCPADGEVLISFGAVTTSSPSGTGIQVGGATPLEGTVVIIDTVVRGGSFGIRGTFDQTGSLQMVGGRIANSTSTGIDVSGKTGAAVEVIGTLIDCPSAVCSQGIAIGSDIDADILLSEITGFVDRGIEIQGSQASVVPFLIQDSEVSRIGTPGGISEGAILIQERLAGTIEGTSVHTVLGETGIHLACSQNLVLQDNRIARIDGDGIRVDEAVVGGVACSQVGGSTNILVDSATLARLSGSGIELITGLGHILENNTISNAADDGVFVQDTVTDSTLTDNFSRRNDDDGFQLDTADLTLTSNRARNNTGFGFETNFVGPVAVDNGNSANNNTAGECSDPNDLPTTTAGGGC